MKKINILLSQLSKYKEAFSTWKYRVPNNPEHQLYDFYVLMSINVSSISDENLLTAYNEALETLVNYLYPELIEAVFFGICCEYRHTFDRNPVKSFFQFASKHPSVVNPKKVVRFLSVGWEISNNMTSADDDRVRNYFSQESASMYSASYKQVLTALRKSGMSKLEFVGLMYHAFNELTWSQQYGGNAWASVAKGWIKAKEAEDKPVNQRALAIDLMYSLQHNTGTIFNKLQKYYVKQSHEWILKALDKKFKVTDPIKDLWNYVSHNLKSFAAALYKNTTGKSMYSEDDYTPPSKEKDSLFFDIEKTTEWYFGECVSFNNMYTLFKFYLLYTISKNIQTKEELIKVMKEYLSVESDDYIYENSGGGSYDTHVKLITSYYDMHNVELNHYCAIPKKTIDYYLSKHKEKELEDDEITLHRTMPVAFFYDVNKDIVETLLKEKEFKVSFMYEEKGTIHTAPPLGETTIFAVNSDDAIRGLREYVTGLPWKKIKILYIPKDSLNIYIEEMHKSNYDTHYQIYILHNEDLKLKFYYFVIFSRPKY